MAEDILRSLTNDELIALLDQQEGAAAPPTAQERLSLGRVDTAQPEERNLLEQAGEGIQGGLEALGFSRRTGQVVGDVARAAGEFTPVGDVSAIKEGLEEGDAGSVALGTAGLVGGPAVDLAQSVFVPLFRAVKSGLIDDKTADAAEELLRKGDYEGARSLLPEASLGVDNIARFEIPDEQFKFKPQKDFMGFDVQPEMDAKTLNSMLRAADRKAASSGEFVKLGDIFEHPKLFEAFPELEKVKILPARSGKASSYDTKKNLIRVASGESPDVIIHELQHAIQSKLGTPGGANSAVFQSKLGLSKEKADEFYRKIIGEVEARDAAKRFVDAVQPGERKTAIDKSLVNAPQEEQVDTGILKRWNPKFLSQNPLDSPKTEESIRRLFKEGNN